MLTEKVARTPVLCALNSLYGCPLVHELLWSKKNHLHSEAKATVFSYFSGIFRRMQYQHSSCYVHIVVIHKSVVFYLYTGQNKTCSTYTVQ